MKIRFQYPVYIPGIYQVYNRYIPPLGIYMVYTWYIPTYLVGIPDERDLARPKIDSGFSLDF
jgi:hypothetical protein